MGSYIDVTDATFEADVLTRSPYLGRPGAGADFGGGQRGAGPSGTDMNSLIRRAAGRT